MLPTSGLFKDIDCPYYDNYCGRSYCHFRHRKRSLEPTEDSQDGEMGTTDIPTYKPTPKSQLAQVKSHIPISYVPDTVIRPERISRMPPMYNYTEKLTYKPTPLSELSKNNAIAINLHAGDLYKIDSNKLDATVINNLEAKDNENCDIDFEELSTEFDMIDDIINDTPCVQDEQIIEKQEVESKPQPKKEEKPAKNIKSSSNKSKSSKESSKSSTSKSKDDKSKHSKSRRSSSSSSSHKSSHKLKQDNHTSRSSSKESSKTKSSDSKRKDDKKDDKKQKQSSNSSSSSSKDKRETDSRSISKDKNHQNKDSKKSSASSNSSSSKHKEYDKSKRKEKEKVKDTHSSNSSSKGKRKKGSKSSSGSTKSSKDRTKEETSKYELSEEEFNNKDDDEDLFAEDLEEECYRIFNEYKPEIASNPAEVACDDTPQLLEQQVEEYVPTSKKRIAHMGAEQFISKFNHVKTKPASQNPALQMTSRYKIAKEAQTQEENDIVSALNKHGTKRQNLMLESYQNMKKAKLKHRSKKDDDKIQLESTMNQESTLVDDIINGRSGTLTQLTYKPTPIAKLTAEEVRAKPKKIAPAMNVSSIQQAKIRIAEFAKKREATTVKTPVQTLGKGNKRVAHIPDTSLAELPDVLQPENKKIPVNVRTRYLTMIADECVKLYLNREDAYSRAINEEVKVMERCAAIVTYRNSAMLAVNRIRKEFQEREAKGLGPISSDESSATDVNSQFKGKRFYTNILQYVLKEEELEEHGYPREGPIAGRAVIKCCKQLPRVNLDENQRLCCRCFKVYLIDDKGMPVYKDECLYHPLKKRTLRGERLYLCCKSTDDSGCVTSNTHVSESEETDLLGFQTTMDPSREDDPRNYAVYALDCEMCYTTKGLELTRVTIIDPDCKTVYESLVKPMNPIIDYNTQFSGITKEQMDRTSTSILQVQANILHLCNSNTILMGHSLESDMKALKIVHSCVVDTSILFPHRLGLPHKRALRNLASEHLNKIIQSDVGGHDSAEDAITCMELVMWKLKEDLKVKSIK